MGIEKTLILLKPDAIRKGVEFEILDRFRKKGLDIVDMYKTKPSEALLRMHYSAVIKDKGEEMGKRIVESMSFGPIIVAVIEGNDAVNSVRNMGGDKTEPIKCMPGTIRHDYSTDSYDLSTLEKRAVQNIIHSSDSKDSAAREIALWFKDKKPSPYEEIAGIIGYDAPDYIKDIVEASNNKRFIFHGISNPDSVKNIVEGALKPMTPENGPCSCWATGLPVFLPTIDSVLFNYSGRYDPRRNMVELNVVLANYGRLAQKGIAVPEFRPDSQFFIKEAIPFDSLGIVCVKVKHQYTADLHKLRGYRQMAEKEMLRSIDSQINGDFQAGKIIYIEKETSD